MSYFLAAFLLTAFTRFYAAGRHRRGARVTDGDAMGHLTYVKEYYRTGGKPMDLTYLYLLDEADYPNGFHKLIYYLRIPVAWLERYGGYAPALFDLMLLAVVALAMKQFGGEHREWLLAFPALRMFWGNAGRACHFSERAYGVLLGNLYLLGAAGFYLTGAWPWLAVALPAFTLFSISSKFAWQATGLLSLMLGLLTGAPFFVGLYLAMLAAAALITRGYALRVLAGLLRHSHFYKTYLAPRNPMLRNHYGELLRIGGAKRYLTLLLTSPPLRIVTDNPLMLVIAASFVSHAVVDFWMLWALAGGMLVLLIATPALQFLGEPERYLEFCVIPVFVVLSFVSPAAHPLAVGMAALTALAVLLFQCARLAREQKNSTRALQEDMLALRRFFSSIQGATVVTIPFRLSFFLGYENNRNRFVTLFSNIGKGAAGAAYRALMPDRYPFPRRDLEAVIGTYGVRYIVAHKAAVESMAAHYGGAYYDFSPYRLAYENRHYAVYEVGG